MLRIIAFSRCPDIISKITVYRLYASPALPCEIRETAEQVPLLAPALFREEFHRTKASINLFNYKL